MWIKICGTTSIEDAMLAADSGASALGFVFAPSSRRVTPKDVAPITAAVPSKIEKIGVFVNQQPGIILETAKTAGLTGVQLQGQELPEVAAQLRKGIPGLTIIKTVRMRDSLIAKLDLDVISVYDALLFDSGTVENPGGTGVTFDWEAAAPMIRFLAKKFRVIVAGGLKPANVAQAISLFNPAGVDVVTGVEAEPGRKDPDKLRAFFQAAHAAEKN